LAARALGGGEADDEVFHPAAPEGAHEVDDAKRFVCHARPDVNRAFAVGLGRSPEAANKLDGERRNDLDLMDAPLVGSG